MYVKCLRDIFQKSQNLLVILKIDYEKNTAVKYTVKWRDTRKEVRRTEKITDIIDEAWLISRETLLRNHIDMSHKKINYAQRKLMIAKSIYYSPYLNKYLLIVDIYEIPNNLKKKSRIIINEV